jgi:hypothetical protein
MPFDGKVSDYFETKPAPVYDRDNPPPTMAEAIRMAVADVEAQERAGIQYEWRDCSRCTAGAVVRRMGGDSWQDFGKRWEAVLDCLSLLCAAESVDMRGLFGQSDCFGAQWRNARFGRVPKVSARITPYKTNPTAFKRDMLALADRLEAEAV